MKKTKTNFCRCALGAAAVFLAGCVNQGYQANSAEEARAYAKRAVETGIVHAGGEQDLFLRKSIGKPVTGNWDPNKIERFVTKWTSANPKRAEINLAATRGVITEGERLQLLSVIDMSEAAEQQRKAATAQVIAAGLNSAAASMNQSAANTNYSAATMNRNTSLYNRPTYVEPLPTTRRIDLHPTYGGGYSGTIR